MAVSREDNGDASTRIQIYSLKSYGLDDETKYKFEMMDDMDGKHENSISCMDWSKHCKKRSDSLDKEGGIREGSIVSCGKDCQVNVWTYCVTSNVWLPSVVVIGNMDSTPIECQWDTWGCRLAIALGGNSKSSAVAICHWDEEFNWWTSSVHVGKKQIKSTVLCVAWHPYLQLIACGGTDYRCRIYSVVDDNHKHREDLVNDTATFLFQSKNKK